MAYEILLSLRIIHQREVSGLSSSGLIGSQTRFELEVVGCIISLYSVNDSGPTSRPGQDKG